MNARLLVGRGGVTDKRGETWNLDTLSQQMGRLADNERVLFAGFDLTRPVGKFVGVYHDTTEDGFDLYADVWLDEALCERVGLKPEAFTVVAPGYVNYHDGAKLVTLAALTPATALWEV
jgi:hypothetical protein